jgi:hypothetical protein
LKFVDAVLRFGQCVEGWVAVKDSAREESVVDDVVLSRDLLYVFCELGYKIEMIELPREAFVTLLLEGISD